LTGRYGGTLRADRYAGSLRRLMVFSLGHGTQRRENARVLLKPPEFAAQDLTARAAGGF